MPSPPNAMRAPPVVSAPATNTSVGVAQRAPVPAAARDRDRGIVGADRLAVGEIHVAVGREVRMQRDVHEPRQPLGAHLGHAGDGLCVELAGADHAQRSGALRDEDGVVRDERETPRPREPARDDRDLDVLAFGRLVAHGRRRQRRLAEPLRRHGNVVAERHLLLRRERCSGDEQRMPANAARCVLRIDSPRLAPLAADGRRRVGSIVVPRLCAAQPAGAR